MKPFIRIEGVCKQFGDFVAVDTVDLEIGEGEFFTILGGSGCGKTTLLRMLAGFEQPSSGRIIIDDNDMSDVPAHRRPVNMMFQSYALFPHMSVVKNVAYGLRQDGISNSESKTRVAEALELVQMAGFEDRKPAQLSGGQCQRVALARALVKRPKALLLDEPMAALDKKLREKTQFELVRIQEQTGITFVLVTHDQEEAMMLSSRIAVMNQGCFTQIGAPTDIYEYPRNRFTAEFIGSINSFAGSVTDISGKEMTVKLPDIEQDVVLDSPEGVTAGDTVWLAIRPEKLWITDDTAPVDGRMQVCGTVCNQGYFGNLSLYRVVLDSGKTIEVSAQNRNRSVERRISMNDRVTVDWVISSMVTLLE